MGLFPITLITLTFIGIIFILISIFVSDKSEEIFTIDNMQVDNSLHSISTALQEADSVINELDSFSKSVLNEMDEKYKEMLYLYSLVDEKKKEVFTSSAPQKLINNTVEEKKDKILTNDSKSSYRNQRTKEILELLKQGVSIPEIAKALSLGQGEVQLIIELSKVK